MFESEFLTKGGLMVCWRMTLLTELAGMKTCRIFPLGIRVSYSRVVYEVGLVSFKYKGIISGSE